MYLFCPFRPAKSGGPLRRHSREQILSLLDNIAPNGSQTVLTSKTTRGTAVFVVNIEPIQSNIGPDADWDISQTPQSTSPIHIPFHSFLWTLNAPRGNSTQCAWVTWCGNILLSKQQDARQQLVMCPSSWGASSLIKHQDKFRVKDHQEFLWAQSQKDSKLQTRTETPRRRVWVGPVALSHALFFFF